MFNSVHQRAFDSVSNWPQKSLDQQQSQRWRAGVMHLAPAGHWWTLEGLQTPQQDSSEPLKSKRTVHVPNDMDNRVHCAAQFPFADPCVASKGCFEFSSTHHIVTIGKGHSVGQTDILVHTLVNAKLFISLFILVVVWLSDMSHILKTSKRMKSLNYIFFFFYWFVLITVSISVFTTIENLD